MKILLLLIILYLELSFGEVFIHKEIYHNKPDSFIRRYRIYDDEHIKHHFDVLNDMSLKDGYHEDSLFFTWFDLSYITLLIFLVWYPTINLFYEFEWYYVLISSILISLFYKVMWDKLHYSFHKINDISVYKSNPIYNWLYNNHMIHHLTKGNHKGNYNIILPGADHILGLYRSKII
tara:strand:+ start:304 stop:834 length:531 start_codon:yes stop_codon:yes gene_type:complete